MDTLLKAPLYIIATNPYLVPNLPILFGKLPGDEYYSLIKYFFFFLIIALITLGIFAAHNQNLANDPTRSDDIKNAASNWKTTLSDSLTIMFVVMLLYFLISMLFLPVQLVKIEYEELFNSFFFIIAFGIISFVYTLITDNLVQGKNPNDLRTNIMGVGIVVLYILYILNDASISGGIPGLNLIPVQVRKLMNLAIKIDGLRTGGNPLFLKELRMKLTEDGQITNMEVNKLIKLTGIALSSMPPVARAFIEKFKKQTNLLDKLLGPVDLNNITQMSEFIGNPIIKIMLALIQV